ncbi:MAG: VCBS repeat-containing protein [Acidobacteria bacterium]|nr:VCBS repeat-containing protein [Acidobacteriota bacterium]
MKRSSLAIFLLVVVTGASFGQKEPRPKRQRPGTQPVRSEVQATEEASTPVVINRLADTLDFNNDGKSDFSIYRQRSASGSSNLEWYVRFNGSSAESYNVWGLAADYLTPGDYDGDGKADIAVWRNDPEPAYYIIQSSNGVLRNFKFGKQNDFPVPADYDGDGKTDPAVWREGQQAQFWYQSSKYGGQVMVPWGSFGDTPVTGDFNGDGLADFRVMRNDGNGNAVWLSRYSVPIGTALPADSREVFGRVDDDFVPGDFDGDGKSDLCVTRIEGAAANWVWYIKSSQTGAITRTAWGLSNQDLESPGDYDGDGKTDIAVWRYGSQNGAQSSFIILKSSDGNTMTVPYGLESSLDTNLAWSTVSVQLQSLFP